jgi:peptidoglycan/LPS O-acetylase OafA/YrhL
MHKNNFDFLRILFAIMVVFTHCYAITGMGEVDALYFITRGQLVFSFIGLSGFFTLSGYLILKSLLRSTSIFEYLKKRILRIYPAFIILMIVTFIIGAIVSTLSIVGYLKISSPYTYVISQLSLFGSFQTTIDSVFCNGTVNASLWTIAYEFSFYILLIPFFLIKKYPKTIRVILIVTFIILFVTYKHFLSFASFWFIPGTVLNRFFLVYYGLFFCAGCILATIDLKRLKQVNFIILGCILLSIIFIRIHHFNLAKVLLLPPIFILIGLKNTSYLSRISNKVGDLSYGVYIYGFLIQQTVLNYFPMNYWHLFLTVMPILFIMALTSWHLIEKRALTYK